MPTLGSDAIGVRELVIDGETGFLTPLYDVDALVEGIKKLVLNSELRSTLGKNAREKIGEVYSLRNASRAQLQMYVNTSVLSQDAVDQFESVKDGQ